MLVNTRICVPGFIPFVILLLVVSAGCKGKIKGNDEKDMSPSAQASLYLYQGRYDEAEVSFAKAIQLSPGEIGNYIDLSRLYLLQKDYIATEKQVAAGLKIQPGNLDLQLIQAEIYIQKQEKEKATRQLLEILIKDPTNVRADYKLSNLPPAGAGLAWRESYLLKIIRKVPANIVSRLELATILAESGKADSARFFLESIRKITHDFSSTVAVPYLKAISLLQGDKTSEALLYIQQFHNLMKLAPEYAYGLSEIDIPGLTAGLPTFITSWYSGSSKATNLLKKDNLLASMKFTDASGSAGAGFATEKIVNAENSVLAIADYDVAGNMYLYTSFLSPGATNSRYYFYSTKIGGFSQDKFIKGLEHDGQDEAAAFADYDNDGYQDLFVVTTKGTLVFKNEGDGHFSRVSKNTGLGSLSNANKLLFADFDQDGDLDLYVAANSGNKFFRNNGDDTFTNDAGVTGLTATSGKNMDFGDWDSDGDLDIVSVDAGGALQLLNNDRHSRFRDIADSLTNKQKYTGTAVAFGDYNNDGRLDIFVAGAPDGKCSLLENTEDRGLVPDPASRVFENALKGVAVRDAVFFDFDNDGHQDILVSGVSNNNAVSSIQLFHNDSTRGFSNVTYLLPKNVLSGHHIAIADFNFDGDEDVFLSGPDGIRLLRNDGGNMNGFLQVQLVGLSYGNSKNNKLGIGAQLELKAGDLYQLKTVTRPVMQFGVGNRDSLDAVRIIWPNGVAQVFQDPSRLERTVEQEKLKGSCPFLFTWNGDKYEFIKDMMWRSAMGMPLAFNGKDTTYAFSDASKEYLLIPGEKLQPKDGKYTIKITEELWETVYFDKAELAAIDHPDSVVTYVDERFVAPPFPGRKIYPVAHKYPPVSATDGKGNNLLPKISAYDFQYVSNFSLGKYQGLAEDHDLILDLGDKAKTDSLLLFLRGWIFPTDASINTALAQSDKYRVHPPSLQVINKKGEWQTVIDNAGFPMGRDKIVIADLSGKFLTASDRRVRIRTNMQIYWDEAFFSTGTTNAPVQVRGLAMLDARLGHHGYSTSYRKGGPYGPEWFDYYDTGGGQQWRDLTGFYTRYGDVKSLLHKGDDQYIIANSGDEITIDFDARQLPPVPKGWKRDFIIYSEGWVKDGDLNTAHGQTVTPLPYHNMPSYPYNENFAYPSDKAHLKYQQEYNTRKINTQEFRNALKPVTSR